MEYLRGRPLRLIREEGQLTIERACRIATHASPDFTLHTFTELSTGTSSPQLMLVSHLGQKDFVKICDFGFAAMLLPDEVIRKMSPSLLLELS